jgi:alkanesulfonate monooxygenase SsuD/methylene tetrahydromethanopterin reductase-like flavin-dependent oxidoreductase (luciferase family)
MSMTHPLLGPHKFKLGVFSTNADGGLALTTVPQRWKATWPDNVAAAKMADDGGFDFFLPIARWAGFGGETKAREWSFETFTWAAGLAALTSRITIFATVHVPLVHPIYAAKALATVDHISNGRAGLNIVCGWNPKEFAMFGTAPDERAYERAAEWISIVERAYAADEPFDFDGAYYKLKGVVSKPASLQLPRPVTMNAAFGGPGRDFAARHCDFLFSTFTDIEDGRKPRRHPRARKRRSGCRGRCLSLSAERRRRRPKTPDRYALARPSAAVDNHMAGKKQFSQSHDERAYREYRQRFAGGAGTYPLIGTPERIAETIVGIASEGWSGAALSFLNYTAEVPFFIAKVFPLLRAAGLKA